MEEAQPGHKAASAASASAGRGTGVLPAGAPAKSLMKTGPGLMKTGVSTGPGKTAQNVISSGSETNPRKFRSLYSI
jgi:hypothetical protein